MHTSEVTVAVIGASLAGASAALHLARSGVSVAVFEKSSFPRRKSCGEGLSVQAMGELSVLGLRERLTSLTHVPFYGFRFFERRKHSEIILQPQIHGIGVRRYDLDALLTEECIRQGIQIHLGKEPQIVRRSDSNFEIVTDSCAFRAKYLILATGALSALPQRLGVPAFTRTQSRCGLSVPLLHSRPHKLTTVDIFVDSKIQACSTPVDADTTTLSLFCSNDTAHRLTPAQRPLLLAEVCDRLQMDAAPSESALTVSGLGRVYRSAYHRSIFIVGDAFRQLDPIGGMGMTQALITGRVAAKTITEMESASPVRAASIAAKHPERMQRAVRRLIGYTSLTYWSLSTSLGRRTIGTQKVGGLAREVLLSMHRPSALTTPYGLLSKLLIESACLW
jgi:flavin-dependent dehydrogenase